MASHVLNLAKDINLQAQGKNKRNTKKCVPLYITIQLLNSEAKKITEHSQREMVRREGNSKSGDTKYQYCSLFLCQNTRQK